MLSEFVTGKDPNTHLSAGEQAVTPTDVEAFAYQD